MGDETVDAPLEPWALPEVDHPGTADTVERLRFPVGYAILAPSGHNTQPWLFRPADGVIELYADRALVISCGAALGTLRIAARRLGHRAAVEVMPDPRDDDLPAVSRVCGGSRRAKPTQSCLVRSERRAHGRTSRRAMTAFRSFDLGKGQAARDRELAEGSPFLPVFVTDSDGPAAWLATGRALQRVPLRARAAGVWSSFMNQPIEVAQAG